MENNTKVTQNKKKHRPKKRKNKLVLVFDENARREFLTGFHKRKLQRKNKAKEEFEKQLKIERKRIKAEAKEQYKSLLLSQKPIPELNDILSENIDMGTHSVSVTELSAADLAKKNNWIGINEVHYENQNDSNEENESESQNGKNKLLDAHSAHSYKEFKKKIKQEATNKIKNSTVFQKKAKLEKIKNIKLKKKQERKLEKLKKKQNKKKKN